MPAAALLLERALVPSAEPDDDVMAQRILDAALELAAASGFRHLTMDDVARRARVGRMTVYRRFGSRTALIDALTIRECRRCLATIASAMDPTDPMAERLAGAFAATLTVIREHPLLARLARFEPEALLQELHRDNSAVFKLVRSFLRDLIVSGQEGGEMADGDPELLAELAIRLGASFVLIPETVLPLADEPATRATIRSLLAPLTLQGC
jgi:AcrR family transcriptional regulator